MLGRTIRVDHVSKYRPPEDNDTKREAKKSFESRTANELYKSALGDLLEMPRNFDPALPIMTPESVKLSETPERSESAQNDRKQRKSHKREKRHRVKKEKRKEKKDETREERKARKTLKKEGSAKQREEKSKNK